MNVAEVWEALSKRAQNLGSDWVSYTLLGSFVLYVLGYLTLRFHLTVLGVGADLSVLDERYLFTGTRFLLYFTSLIPSLLLLVLIIITPIYLPYLLTPSSIRLKVSRNAYCQWRKIRAWWMTSNRLVLLGIIFALLMIQLVMRQCMLLRDLLLAENLDSIPAWLRYLLLTENEISMVLYFGVLLAGVLISASIFYSLTNNSNDSINTALLKSLLGFLLCIQLLLIPVNYGILVIDKSIPRVTELNEQGTLNPNQQAWLVWEGNEGKTFLLRTQQQTGQYKKSLLTLPNKLIKRVEISSYDRIFKFLFSPIPAIPELKG